MSNPWTISGNRTLLSAPTYGWERFGLPINEGPQILVHEGQLHVIYSASGYWTHQYSLGRLTYDGVGSIMNANSWTKAPTPVFQQSGDVVGTGHASFVKSPDGTEDWIVYHAHHDRYNWQDDRDILIQQFTFNADGTPNFGAPIPKTTPVEVPSGYVDADRPLVPGDYDASGVTNAADLAVFAGLFALPITPGISADGDANGIVDGSDFLLWQRNFGATPAVTAAVDAASEPASGAVAESASEPAIVAALQAAEGATDSPTALLLNAELIDLAFAAEAYWRIELLNDDATSAKPFVAAEQFVTENEATPLAAGWGNAPPARRTTPRFRWDVVPAYEEELQPVDYFFPDLFSANES